MSGRIFSLLADQIHILKIVDFMARLTSSSVRAAASRARILPSLEDVIDGGNILFEFPAAIADRFQFVLQDVVQELFDLHVAEASTGIVGLHFFDVLIVREVALEMFGAAESVQIDEYGVILDLTGVFPRGGGSGR